MKTKKQINATIDKDLYDLIVKENDSLSTFVNQVLKEYFINDNKNKNEISKMKNEILEIKNQLIEMKKQNDLTENFVRQTVNYSQANLIVLSDNSEKAKKFLSDIKQKYENN
jgi:hypothetical protein